VRHRPRARAAVALAAPTLALAVTAACHCGGPLPEESLFDCRDAGWDCAWCDHSGACVLLLDGGAAGDAGQGGGACTPFAGQRICSVDGGVCWEHPLPQGNDLFGVWGTASSGAGASIWAVGAAGTILHWNGSAWSKVESGTRRDLLSVWSERADEAWVTGTGGTWFKVSLQGGVAPVSSASTNDLLDVWGDPDGAAIWAVGYGGKVFRLDRSLTLPAADLSATNPSIALYAVYGVAGSNVWVAGANGALYEYPSVGGPKLRAETPLPYDFFDLWMPSSGALIVSTKDGGVQTSNGAGAWTAASIPPPAGDFALAIWGDASTSELWVRGFDGLSYYRSPSPLLAWSAAQEPSRLNVRDVWGDSSAVWSVGEKGYLGTWSSGARWDAKSFGLFPPRPTGADLLAVQDLGCEAWAGGRNGQLLHRTDAGWSQQLRVNGPITALWAPGPGEVWYAADAGRASRIMGGGAPSERPVPLQGQVRAFSGVATNAIWAVGEDGGVASWNGLTWNLQPTPERVTLNAVLALARDDVWAAGDSQTVLHFDGGTWSTVMAPGGALDLRAIAASPARVYFAGGKSILIYEQGAWNSGPDVSQPINALAVDAAGRLWVAGAAGSLGYLPADGSAFHPVDALTKGNLNALSAAGAQLLIAGDSNAILDAPGGAP